MTLRQLPGNLDQAIFRIGAFAFCSLGTLALVTDYVGPGLQVTYPAVWAVTALAVVGGGIDMATNLDDEVIVRATMDLARNLGLPVVAEGVEDEATWHQLSALGCDRAQGFHLSPPLPEKEFVRWLRHWSELVAATPEAETRRRVSVVA